jgi:hypothetical protein
LAGVRILFGDTADLADNPRAGLKTLFGDTFALTDVGRAAFVFEASNHSRWLTRPASICSR